jgi:hypothetical protein
LNVTADGWMVSDELEYFYSSRVNQTSLKLICNELKSLVELHVTNVDTQGTLEISKLRKLKSLNITIYNETSENANTFLSFMSSSSIETLSTEIWNFAIEDSTVAHIGFNFPQLKELKFESRPSINLEALSES